ILTLASLIYSKRPAHKKLVVELPNCLVGLSAFCKFHKCKATRFAGFAVYREVYVGKRSYGGEEFTQRRLRRGIREVSNKKTDSHPIPQFSVVPTLRVKACLPPRHWWTLFSQRSAAGTKARTPRTWKNCGLPERFSRRIVENHSLTNAQNACLVLIKEPRCTKSPWLPR